MKIVITSLSLGALTLLAGCVSSNDVYTSQGNMIYAINCKFQSLDACLEKAGETCGSLGYKQVAADGGPVPVVETPPAETLASKIGWDRKIYVKCRP